MGKNLKIKNKWLISTKIRLQAAVDDIVRRLDGLSSGLSLHTIKVQILKTLKNSSKNVTKKPKNIEIKEKIIRV